MPYPSARHPEEGHGEAGTRLEGRIIDGAYLYILLCADGSYYVGTTVGGLERRLAEHDAGTFDGYTARRRPVKLLFQHFERLEDAAAAERQIKGWRREKKEALIRGDYTSLQELSRRTSRSRTKPRHPEEGHGEAGTRLDGCSD